MLARLLDISAFVIFNVPRFDIDGVVIQFAFLVFVVDGDFNGLRIFAMNTNYLI